MQNTFPDVREFVACAVLIVSGLGERVKYAGILANGVTCHAGNVGQRLMQPIH